MRALSSLSMSVVSSAARRPHRHRHLNRLFLLGKQNQSPLPFLVCCTTNTNTIHHQPLVSSGFRLMSMCSREQQPDSDSDSVVVVVPSSVPVRVAYELLQAGHHYLDVRTPEEFSAGHPIGAVNVPCMFKAGDGMQKNPDFLEHVSKHFGKDDEIIVGCQSGRRSLMAATDLSSVGFSGVTDIAGGYSAWKQTGLPTE